MRITSMESISEFERAVMNKLLAGRSEEFEILRRELSVAQVLKKELSGVGFFTEFSVPPEAPKLPSGRDFWFGDVGAEIKGLQHGAGFLLLVENGYLKCWKAFLTMNLGPTM
jgi:hypothetical protein